MIDESGLSILDLMNFGTNYGETTRIDVNEIKGYIEIPKDANMGDYAFPCFSLAKSLRKAPQMIATEIKEKIDINEYLLYKIT